MAFTLSLSHSLLLSFKLCKAVALTGWGLRTSVLCTAFVHFISTPVQVFPWLNESVFVCVCLYVCVWVCLCASSALPKSSSSSETYESACLLAAVCLWPTALSVFCSINYKINTNLHRQSICSSVYLSMVQIVLKTTTKKPTKQICFKTSEYARAHIVLWAVFLSSFLFLLLL